MKSPVTSSTRLFALLGDPVGHSLSPVLQNAALSALGLDAVYVALRCAREEVPGLIRGIARAGGGGNVTLPHKEVAATCVDEPTEAVVRTGACNTFWAEEGRVQGDNTDVTGFRAAAVELLGAGLSGVRVLLVGAGGSARSVAYSLAREGAEEVLVLNRSRANAEKLVHGFTTASTSFRVVSSIGELRGRTFDLLVNATSLGLETDDELPFEPDAGATIGAVLDLVYRPQETPLVLAFRERGVPAADGLEMLLQQGAAAFTRWWGLAPPVETMRASLPRR